MDPKDATSRNKKLMWAMYTETAEINRIEYFIAVELSSYFPFVSGSKTWTTHNTCEKLEEWFFTLGYPRYISTKGENFKSEIFKQFCKERLIITKQQENPRDSRLIYTLSNITYILRENNNPRIINKKLYE